MEAKDRTVAPTEVCADILGNPCSLLPYSIEIFFSSLLDAFKRHGVLSCSKSVMSMWNINSEVSSYWASVPLGLAGEAGLRCEPDSIPRLISDSLCDTKPCISHVFYFKEPFSIAVLTEHDFWVHIPRPP